MKPAAGDRPTDDATSGLGSIAPEDSFLVQIRGGSRPADRVVSGRIEHLSSGDSEPFQSLAELIDFVGRYFDRNGLDPGPRAT